MGAETDDDMGPLRRAAIEMRMREKKLLNRTLMDLEEHKTQLANLTYQISEVRRKEAERQRRIKEAREWKENVRKEAAVVPTVVDIPIDLGSGQSANFTVYEGDDSTAKATEFGEKYGLTKDGQAALISAAKKGIKEDKKHIIFTYAVFLDNGTKTTFRLRAGDNGTEEVLKFCAINNVSDAACDNVRYFLAPRLDARNEERDPCICAN